MAWGDWPSWVAIVVSVVTAAVGYVQSRRQARAATAGAAQATALAQEADRSAASMARSLDAIAATLAARGGVAARELTADRPARPAWNVEFHGGDRYVLRNVGDGAATAVRVEAASGGLRDVPDGSSLAAGEGARFVVAGTRPPAVTVSCAETGAESVPMP